LPISCVLKSNGGVKGETLVMQEKDSHDWEKTRWCENRNNHLGNRNSHGFTGNKHLSNGSKHLLNGNSHLQNGNKDM